MRLLQFTDTHLHSDPQWRSHGVDTRTSLEQVLAVAAARTTERPIDGIILSGDLVNDDPAAYGLLEEYFTLFNVPLYCLPGNHDEARQLQQQLNKPPFQLPGCYDLGAWCLVTLDSSLPGHVEGELNETTLAWLQKTLGGQTKPTLIVLHHPPLHLKTRWLDNLRLKHDADFRDLLQTFPQVKNVLFGHAHQAYDQNHNGIRYLCTPSTCMQFLPRSDDFAIDETAQPGYRWLDLHTDGRLETGLIRVNNP